MGRERLQLGSHEEVRDGVPLRYTVTTIPEHLTETVVQHMTTAFLPREIMCSHFKLHEDPKSLAAIQGLWKGMIKAGAALVAVRDGPGEEADRVVGANITYILNKNSEKPQVVRGTEMELVYDAVVDIASKAKIFERYGVDRYLSAFGLSVHPEYHGYKIGERLLQARELLCKSIGIKVTGTVYTHVKAMHLSKKVGFVVLYEEEYSKYIYNGVVIFEGEEGKFEQSAWVFSDSSDAIN